jgi:hypothetical protein
LAPIFYVWVLLVRKREVLLPFLALLLPFIGLHLLNGVEEKTYTISLMNVVLVYFFCQAAYTFFLVCENHEYIFRTILVINFALCVVAVIVYFTPYWELMWMEQNISKGVKDVRRLKMFTYEPSYYALLFVPVFFFYFLEYCFSQNRLPAPWLLIMISLPLILSFSIGVISAIFISIFGTGLFYLGRLVRLKRIFNLLLNSAALMLIGLLATLIFFRNSPLVTRFTNILAGNDPSGKGRTSDAFVLAEKLLKEKNEYWGVGVGQVKIIGANIIRHYYLYTQDYVAVIPNAAAETLAIFGWVGFTLRLMIEAVLFFVTKVWKNYFRLLLFLFMFIYQFSGSYITNPAEYVIWILAFLNVFPQFNVTSVQKGERSLASVLNDGSEKMAD